MNIINEKQVMIFRRDYQDRTYYSMGLSKKLQDGTYESGSISCQFKKGIVLNDKDKIYIKNAWLTFYKDKDKKSVPYVFINEYETVEQKIEQEKDPFKEFAEENNITDDMLPF